MQISKILTYVNVIFVPVLFVHRLYYGGQKILNDLLFL
jgi:hypothetical protein